MIVDLVANATAFGPECPWQLMGSAVALLGNSSTVHQRVLVAGGYAAPSGASLPTTPSPNITYLELP